MHLISVVIQLKGFLSRIVDKPKTELDVTRGASVADVIVDMSIKLTNDRKR